MRRRIAVTGHVDVSDDVATWVRAALTERLRTEPDPPVRGITCLARGADQLFAQVVLDLKGSFDVVLPARDYPQYMRDHGHDVPFFDLLNRATAVETLDRPTSDRDAYLAASVRMLDRCDLLLAVWDGRPSRGTGDTADVVGQATLRGLPVERIWPPAPPAPDGVTPAGAPGHG